MELTATFEEIEGETIVTIGDILDLNIFVLNKTKNKC